MRIAVTAVLAVALCGARASHGAEEKCRVLPFDVPKLTPAPSERDDSEKTEKLIASLAQISKPDFGLSPTLSGSDFPPVPGSARPGTFLFTDHRLQRSDGVTRLVTLGPRALPSLLEHIDDATPTQLVIKHETFVGAMWYAAELPVNPASSREKQVGTSAHPERELAPHGDSVDRHVVSVGDVCFLLVGMITNRAYKPVRYQPSGCVVINSPLEEPRLAKAVRSLWGTRDANAALLRHLLIDFHTRGTDSYRLQCGAAMRLLYYFPEYAAPLIAKRIRGFDFTMPDCPEDSDILARFRRNGVPESDFIEAVAWHTGSRVRDAVRAAVLGCNDAHVVASGAPAMAGATDEAFFDKLRDMLAEANRGYGYPSSGPAGLLRAVATLYPDRAATAFREYLEAGGTESTINVIEYIRSNRTDLALQLLSPLLNDQTEYGRREDKRASAFKGITARIPVRICDIAYRLISLARGDKNARISGTLEEMDERIARLRVRLAEQDRKATPAIKRGVE